MGCVPTGYVRRSLVRTGFGMVAMVAPVLAHAQLSARRIEAFESFGAAHSVMPAGGEVIILSADIVGPNVHSDVNGRRRPVIELGFGYRLRSWTAIGPLPDHRVLRQGSSARAAPCVRYDGLVRTPRSD